MKTDKIPQLIDAFYHGETTPDQEQELLWYFQSEEAEEKLAEEKELFLQLYRSTPVDVPSDLENKLSRLIDKLAEEEKQKPTGMSDKRPASKRKRHYN